VLFMLGAAVIFNLGRDISLLVQWPIIFAYFFVHLTEMWATRRFGQLPQLATIAPAEPGPVQMLSWSAESVSLRSGVAAQTHAH
jgi:hypothetical protein